MFSSFKTCRDENLTHNDHNDYFCGYGTDGSTIKKGVNFSQSYAVLLLKVFFLSEKLNEAMMEVKATVLWVSTSRLMLLAG